MDEPVTVLSFLQQHQDQIVADLGEFVQRESPSTDKPLLNQFAQYLAEYAESCGSRAEILPMQDRGNHVRVRWGRDDGVAILLLGHFDTVWPWDTLERMPFLTGETHGT